MRLCTHEKVDTHPKIQILYDHRLQEQTDSKSLIHADVLAVMRTMYSQEPVLAEYCLSPDLDLRTDIFMPQMQLAIEVNGQSHYLPATGQLTARSFFRTGLIMDLGFGVLNIDHREWSALKGLQSKKEHLASGLSSCLSSRSSGIS